MIFAPLPPSLAVDVAENGFIVRRGMSLAAPSRTGDLNMERRMYGQAA
ncbi:hypothetical protein EDC15_10494 [Acetobacter aceti NBRC 14818]|nr:hypothetical protein EDC15_10494 [Acetobacter aceti NBRC 14818]